MGRKPLTDQQKLERELAKLEKLTGYKPKSPVVVMVDEHKEKSRQAEAVYEFVKKPDKHWIQRQCGNCRKSFLVNYPSVNMCSDQCRRESLEAIGIRWDPNKRAEERWAPADVPLVVPPAALQLLIEASKEGQQSSAASQ